MHGDEDDNFPIEEDWLDGGEGNDRCDGDCNLGTSTSGYSDLWRNCEAHWDAHSDEGLNWINCAATDDPLHEWSVRLP
ncbi:MAG TPA: hypothetical protein VF179_28880 [Thermoanaerobaculia bacterium]|nr:hypothetical protein [Thermoanaerobaculia bacterium]